MPLEIIKRFTATQITLFLAIASFTAVIVFTFPNDISQIHQAWTTASELTHGYPVLLIAFWLIIRNGKHHEGLTDWRMLVPLFTLIFAYVIGEILTIKTIKLLALLFSFPVFLAVILGTRSLRFTIIPTLIIGMALPATYLAIPILLKLTVVTNTFLIKQIGMTAYIEGAYIHLSSGIIWVKGGCSGHKYFTSAMTLALIMISLDRFSTSRSMIIVLLGLGLSLFANWIRVFLLVVVAYRTSVEHPLIHDHDNFGWVVFGIAMIPLFLYWRKCQPLSTEKSNKPPSGSSPDTNSKLFAYGLGSLVIMALPFAVKVNLDQTGASYRPSLDTATLLNDYQTVDELTAPWQLQYKGADYRLRLKHKNKPIFLAIDQYNQQGINKELDNSENKLFAKGWQEITNASFVIPLSQNDQLTAMSKSARHYKQGTYVVLYWHSVNGKAVTPGIHSKLQLLSKLWGDKAPDYVFALASQCNGNCEKALADLSLEAKSLINLKTSLQ